jgi:hypothetical protein
LEAKQRDERRKKGERYRKGRDEGEGTEGREKGGSTYSTTLL